MANEKEFIVYALIHNSNPIYVGCTSDVKNREYNHRLSKVFDYLMIIKSYDTKEEALAVENGIIRFMSLMPDGSFVNALNSNLSLAKSFRDSCFKNRS